MTTTTTTKPTPTVDEQARAGYAAGLFAARYLSKPDRSFQCPHCWSALHARNNGKGENGITLWSFACNNCHTLMMAEAVDDLDAAELLGVLA